MNNKKRNTIITIILVAIILIIGAIIFTLNYTSTTSSLSILEKKWITDNTNKMVDVNVYNDVPVYGYNGSGIIFDFLDYFTEKHNINFNKISYYTTDAITSGNVAFLLLNNQENLQEQDILLYEDYYVVLSSQEKADHISFSELQNIGYLKSEQELLQTYFNDETLTQQAYDSMDQLLTALQEGKIDYIILPNLNCMTDILANNLSIVYHLSDLKKKYVLRVADETTRSVLSKTYLEYLEKDFAEDYSRNYLNIYFTSTKTSDLLQKNYNANVYKYGYVINMPYENIVNDDFVGTISNYLVQFEKITNAEIEVVRFNTIDDLKSALVSGEIDFALGNFDYATLNLETFITNTMADLNYLVLSTQNRTMNSLKGLQDETVSLVSGSLLYELAKENNLTTNTFSDTDDLLRSLDDNSTILIDKQTYLYYKDTKLKEYKVVYEDNISNAYKFVMNAKNEPFNSLYNYYISTINYQQLKYDYNTTITLTKDYTGIKILAFIIALVLFLISTIIFINRKSITNTVLNKDEVLKYIDPMTSLKNRSYLNLNIYNWDDNVIFPQSVVVLDLNKIKEVNDRLGREAGDEIIKKVASILINNQLENTDIIRSGGDEFLIYMVGYEEKKVSEYTKLLAKEMKNIPNSLGVEIGYSMILDEVKTVDDAINEAIAMVTKNKEKRR